MVVVKNIVLNSKEKPRVKLALTLKLVRFPFFLNTIKEESGKIPVKMKSYELKTAHVKNIVVSGTRTSVMLFSRKL